MSLISESVLCLSNQKLLDTKSLLIAKQEIKHRFICKKTQNLHYDASVLCLFVNSNLQDSKKIINKLNKIDW
ncbi:hypothetical protein [Mycoplasma sp. E35C]|uniref:hypothetical protein n=1 Tax=Mycoplasma sp. E35C TaxID=2801918 RepID=UPI001CA3A361|nr:hypothetical protein [Mycoplasma sp. E35C]QZX49271.1 hypothetical protein JJE79_00695 [Mycoplasma sp. E35C]